LSSNQSPLLALLALVSTHGRGHRRDRARVPPVQVVAPPSDTTNYIGPETGVHQRAGEAQASLEQVARGRVMLRSSVWTGLNDATRRSWPSSRQQFRLDEEAGLHTVVQRLLTPILNAETSLGAVGPALNAQGRTFCAPFSA
jgi:hypothetical protein